MKTKTAKETAMKTTRYRHVKGCNWTTKHPDYRGVSVAGVPEVLAHDPQRGTTLVPCACWTASHAKEG